MRRTGVALAAVALAALFAPGAAAQTGGCVFILEGRPMQDGEPITMPEDGEVTYLFEAPRPIRAWTIMFHLGPLDQVVSEGAHDGTARDAAGAFSVGDVSGYGVGILRVTADITMADGSTCAASGLVLMEGNPLATVAGLVTMGIAVGGFAGVIAALVAGFMDGKEFRDAIKDYKEHHRKKRRWGQG